MLLREWQGLSYAEIATELELSQSAVETLLFRARRGLAERLTEEPAEGGKLSRIGRTGDFGSLGAAIKALFFSGGVKIAATLATVAATTVVASAPSVRNDVVHFVAPALPQAASPVKRAEHKPKPVEAHVVSAQTSLAPAAPAIAKAKKAPRAVHRKTRTHTVHSTHLAAAPVLARPAVKRATASTPTTSTVSHTTPAVTVPTPTTPTAPVIAADTAATQTTTTTPATSTETTTTTATATAPPPPPPVSTGDSGGAGKGGGSPATSIAAAVAPSLASFSPSSGLIGTTVAISGGPFNGVTSVKFNGVSAPFSTGQVLLARVPAGATSGPITVTNAAGTSTTVGSFTVVTPAPPPPPVFAPALAGFSPRNATVGATVLIVGAHLTGATAVAFNGVPATFTPGSDTQLTAVVPAGASTGPVTITTPQGSVTSSAILIILAPPTVSSFSPTSGPTGATVTISGSHLGGSPSVKFNGVPANVVTSSDNSLTVQVPSLATSGPITVTTSDGTVTTGSFTVLVPPTFAGLSPGSGVAGTAVTVYGAHFTGATAVTLNGAAAQFTVVSDTQLTVTVPAGATSGPIAVTTPSGSATSSSAFTVAAPPTSSGVSPGSGPVGLDGDDRRRSLHRSDLGQVQRRHGQLHRQLGLPDHRHRPELGDRAAQ